ncbi:MAG TPA: hypothetical protein VK154_12645 [Chitinophagales bacterium]|nr:hypothetical protein [Chitinophagales bacterium]
MATLKQLHDLVHALNKKEKINLNLSIKATTGKARNRYLASIEILNKAKTFDSNKLRNKLSEQVSGMNLSEANNNLYHFICRSLLSFNETQPNTLGLLRQLSIADILISKRQTDAASDLLEATIKAARETRNYQVLHSALVAWQQLDVLDPKRQQNFSGRIDLLDKRIGFLKENIEYLEYRKLAITFFALVKEIGSPRNVKQQQQYEQLLTTSLLSETKPVHDSPLLIQYEYFDLRSMLLSACNRLGDAYKECSRALEIMEVPFRKQKRFDSLQNLMLAKLTYSLELEDIQKVNETCAQLLAIKPLLTNKSRIATLSEKVFHAELFACLKAGRYKEGIAIFEAHLSDPKLSDWQKSPLAYVDYLMGARLYFLAGDADQALTCLLKIQDKEKVMRPSFLIAYKFLFLLCHYRLKNYMYLSNATATLYKALHKMERVFEPEKALLQFLKYAGDYNKWQKGMKKLHQKFTQLQADPFNKAFFTYADYDKWLNLEMQKKRL